jgi:hypothetical protein
MDFLVSGAMLDPLIVLLREKLRMLIPDLPGHGKSGDLVGRYHVAALTRTSTPAMSQL